MSDLSIVFRKSPAMEMRCMLLNLLSGDMWLCSLGSLKLSEPSE